VARLKQRLRQILGPEQELGRNSSDGHLVTSDDVIVELHMHGETVFQAMARAGTIPGVDKHDPALLTEVPEGRFPLATGAAIQAPRLDAAGVAAICTAELEQSTYEAARVLTSEPRPPKKPRVATADLHPVLDQAGYRVSSRPFTPTRRYEPRRLLAERTHVHARLIDRICSGKQKTVAIETAITIYEKLGAYGQAAELNDRLRAWTVAMALYHSDRYEYLDKLAILAATILLPSRTAAFSPTEIIALEDRQALARAAESYPSTEEYVLTAEERLARAEQWFRETRGRDPLPLPRRLHDIVRDAFRRERQAAHRHEQAMHKGLPRPTISTAAVHGRTHRLRRAGRLPSKSKPLGYQPPADFHDVHHLASTLVSTMTTS